MVNINALEGGTGMLVAVGLAGSMMHPSDQGSGILMLIGLEVGVDGSSTGVAFPVDSEVDSLSESSEELLRVATGWSAWEIDTGDIFKSVLEFLLIRLSR